MRWTAAGPAAAIADGTYTLGLRPHFVTPARGGPDQVPLKGVVQITELSGSESVAHFAVGDKVWVAQSNGVHPYRVGETHDFFLDVAPRPLLRRRRPAGGLMAKIGLKRLRHSYLAHPKSPADYALKEIDIEWADGGAYALLGPSGCGKSTLLEHHLRAGGAERGPGALRRPRRDDAGADRAQHRPGVPVPGHLRHHDRLRQPRLPACATAACPRPQVDARVRTIAAMLELTDMLGRRAAGLTADGKQKISMGRGLVREDVNVIMFDEPLTVIDPHLKWQLRSKLKELHQRLRATMIYVTHDQTEALTFADQVVVMQDGEVVQIGSPVDLFERPAHTFVGHFIGSPGMNVLPCELRDGGAFFAGQHVATANRGDGRGRSEIGVRPEFVSLGPSGIPAEVVRVADVGRHRVVEARAGDQRVQRAPARGPPGRARAGASGASPGADPHLHRRLAGGGERHEDREPVGLALRHPGAGARRLQRAGAADDGGQLLGAGDLRQQRLLLARRRLVRGRAALARASTPRSAASCSSPPSSC